MLVCPECGFTILILPDVTAMAKAIDEHAKTHGARRRNLTRMRVITSLTEDLLVAIAKNGEVNFVNEPKKVYLLVESYFGSKRVLGIALTEKEADDWVEAKLAENPNGSYFYETGKIERSKDQ